MMNLAANFYKIKNEVFMVGTKYMWDIIFVEFAYKMYVKAVYISTEIKIQISCLVFKIDFSRKILILPNGCTAFTFASITFTNNDPFQKQNLFRIP